MEQAHDLAESEMETQLQTEINALLNPTTTQPETTPAVPVANTTKPCHFQSSTNLDRVSCCSDQPAGAKEAQISGVEPVSLVKAPVE